MLAPRVLITGAGGFVGPYVATSLRQTFGENVNILGTALRARPDPVFGNLECLDITDRRAVTEAITHFAPSHVVHLAAIAAPSAVTARPDVGWRVHLNGTRYVAQAIMEKVPECVLVHVGSGLVYGNTARSGWPLMEDSVLAPADEYGASKAAADLALGALAARGLKCVRMRPFNHTGPGQSEAFVIPGFAMQIAQAEAGVIPPVIRVGDLQHQRDFLDVRDVADAYVKVIERSNTLEPGLIINVASGVPRKICDILQKLLSCSEKDITVEVDPARLQASGPAIVVGDPTRARQLLGWMPRHEFSDTIGDVLDDCRSRLR